MSKFNPKEIIDFNIDYYGILGLTRVDLPPNTQNNKTEIQQILSKAYAIHASKTHPDNGGQIEDFYLVVRAHTILSDFVLRQIYDSNGELQPRTIEDDNVTYDIDWDKIGNYRKGTLADTTGFDIFLNLANRKQELKLIPAFYPTEFYHSYQWDFVLDDYSPQTKFSFSLVPDEKEVLKLTKGNETETSLPFKIYFCIPRNHLYLNREENSEILINKGDLKDLYKDRIVCASYSDYNLLQTTNLDIAYQYIEKQLIKDIENFRNGTLIIEKSKEDREAEQNEWMSTEKIQNLDVALLRSILQSKSIKTKYNEQAANFLNKFKNKF